MNLTPDQLTALVKKLSPLVAAQLTRTPTFYGGDRSQVICAPGVKLVNTFFNLNSGTVTIGEDTFFGNNVSILTGTHDITKHSPARKNYPKRGNDIKIGKGVWIASHAVILGPCEIGDNTVIAAGSLVLPGTYLPDSIYAGVPAVFKKTIEYTD